MLIDAILGGKMESVVAYKKTAWFKPGRLHVYMQLNIIVFLFRLADVHLQVSVDLGMDFDRGGKLPHML